MTDDADPTVPALSARHKRLREEIMLTVKANGLPVTGEFWLTLIFMSEPDLVKVCHELNIRTDCIA